MKVRKCPKCKSTPESYTEMWTNHAINFDAKCGVPDEIGYLSDGHPYCVYANCECGHSWRLRGVSQITDLKKNKSVQATAKGRRA